MSAGRGFNVNGRLGAARLGLLFVFCLPAAVYCLLSASSLSYSAEESQREPPTSLHRWGAVTLFHGLPSDQVRAVAQDAEGVMWFGTDAGLARYDGRRVQSVTSEGLAGPRVRALAVDESGALWVGADGGAYVRAPRAREFTRVEETRGKSVLAVHAPSQGRALLATADGLVFDCRLERGGALSVRRLGEPLTAAAGKPQSLAVTSLAVEGETVVVGTRGRGLLTIAPDGETKEVAARPRSFYVEALARDAAGALYVGAQTSASDSGVLKIDEGRLARPSKIAGAATGTVTALAADPSGGDLYAATEGRGVFRLSGGRVAERLTFAGTAGALRSDRVNAVFVDREGVAWFGTPRGVCRYDPRGVRVERMSAEQTESNFVRSIHRTSSGRLLVGANRGLFARDEASGAWREVPEVSGKTVYAVAEDKRGLLLVGTGAGLYVGLQTDGVRAKSPVRLAPEESAEGGAKTRDGGRREGPAPSKSDEGAAVGNDRAAAADEGVVAADEKPAAAVEKPAAPTEAKTATAKATPDESAEAVEAKRAPEPALSGSVRAIAPFGDAVYVATFGRGLERFVGPGRRELVWPRAGDDERGREVVSLHPDESRSRLWVGTANAGVFYFDGSSVKAEPALALLGGSTVWGAASAEGWLWLATSRGLYAFKEGRGLIEVTPNVDARAVVALPSFQGQPQAWCATAGVGVLRVTLDEQFGAVVSRLDMEQGLPTDNAFAVSLLPATEAGEGMKFSPAGALLIGTTRGLARYEPGTAAPRLSLVRVAASRTLQPEELQDKTPLRLVYPQNGLAIDVAAAASRTFPEQFLYAFTLRDAKGRAVKQKLSRDSQFQAEALPAGSYAVTARAYTLDLVPSEPLVFSFEVARAPFPRTIVALSVLLALALAALVWAYLQHRRIVRSREELREANHQLAEARLQLASEAEAERRRIARDLHDQTLADLRRLLLLTDEMQQPAVAPAPAPGALSATAAAVTDPTRLRAEIESISQEVRRICEDLSPSVLENVGFAAALEWALASACAQQPAARRFTYDFACDEDLEERLALSHGAQMQVYRIVQEAVSNVCRHARASHVSLTVGLDGAGDFHLTLSDDGVGFDADNKRALKGRGLAGIRARVSLIEADAAWTRREGGGAVFRLVRKAAAKVLKDEA